MMYGPPAVAAVERWLLWEGAVSKGINRYFKNWKEKNCYIITLRFVNVYLKTWTHQVSQNFLLSLMLCLICKILANLIAILYCYLIKSDWNKCFNLSLSVTLSALLFSLIVTKTGPSHRNIHWTNLYSQDKEFSKTNYAIHCRIVIYPMDIIILSLHNWAQGNWTLHC